MRPLAEPLIFKVSRPAIVALAALGVVLTTYLTVTHFTGNAPAFCAAGSGTGCDRVLSSEYAQVFGIPLTVFGALAYLFVGVLAAIPLFDKREDVKTKKKLKQSLAFAVFLASTAMLFFSGYLMYLLAFELKTVCFYCIGSATNVTLIWLLNLLGNDWEDQSQLFFTGLSIGLVVTIGAVGLYSTQKQLAMASSTFAGQLARHLQQQGVKMYGANWCPHCHDQLEKFGEAKRLVPYVECSPNGGPGTPPAKICVDKKITSYPTWEINGQLKLGVHSLKELADLTNYQGPRN
ncbi:MAG: vitamin K epoxide reductase family protein [Pseudanabaenaceae cyanobacterium SKYGB_i_bin29]|nr:vitamin K epoxide reductase family protein [Pseudanabaenaceae cyanobacterium SKYG29]MDW8421034.1 vitamin K epoxide reductase family protein [Pseudanabaenaceae cyanobacterium SKYGB_i_bin29]